MFQLGCGFLSVLTINGFHTFSKHDSRVIDLRRKPSSREKSKRKGPEVVRNVSCLRRKSEFRAPKIDRGVTAADSPDDEGSFQYG